MNLRGHHLFCTALFSGHGYDSAFTEAMETAIKALKAGEVLQLTSGMDELCKSCPNRLESGVCALGNEDVLYRDRAALAVLGISLGKTLSWERAQSLLARLSEDEFQRVCGNCRWQKEGLCSWQLLHQRTSR